VGKKIINGICYSKDCFYYGCYTGCVVCNYKRKINKGQAMVKEDKEMFEYLEAITVARERLL